MAKKKSSSGTNVARTSSGKRCMARARKALRRVKMKIARWKRYKAENKPSWSAEKEKERKSRNRSRYNTWYTGGLEAHAKLLESIIDKGRKVNVTATS